MSFPVGLISCWIAVLLRLRVEVEEKYRVNADVLKQSDNKCTTSLKRIEPYRIRELIISDLNVSE